MAVALPVPRDTTLSQELNISSAKLNPSQVIHIPPGRSQSGTVQTLYEVSTGLARQGYADSAWASRGLSQRYIVLAFGPTRQVRNATKSFWNGFATSPDGLRAEHLRVATTFAPPNRQHKLASGTVFVLISLEGLSLVH